MKRTYLLLLITIFVGGCTNISEWEKPQQTGREQNLTVGIVKKEIRKGMTQTQVAEALGSPNIVTDDGENRETWIYDRIATSSVYTSKSGGIQALILGWGGNIAGGGGPGISVTSGNSLTTQKTLTVIIKFKNNIVYDFSYHASTF